MRFILGISACFLFPFSYGICELVYFDQDLRWHILRCMLFSVSILLAGSGYLFPEDKKTEKYFKVSMCVLVGMVTGDIVDKIIALYKNENDHFSLVDIGFIGAFLYLGIKKYIYAGKIKADT